MSERRRMMMGVKKLPYDAEIEYLESTGTQYIDTYYKPNNTTVLEAKYMSKKAASPFGARWTGANTYDTFGVYVGNNNDTTVYWGRYSQAMYKIVYNVSLSSPTTVKIDITKVTINNSSYSLARNFFTSTYSMYLFCMNSMGMIIAAGISRIYYIKITEGDTTIFDMVPVRIGTTGYMYDKVSKQLFGNAGTGNFTLGPDVN